MHFLDVNLIAVVVAALIYFGLGFLWYSPKLFGPQWVKETKLRPDQLKMEPKTIGLAFLNSLLICFVLAHFVNATQATTFAAGSCVGFWAWLGFVATAHFSGMLWEKRPWKLFAIDVTIVLIAFLLIGGLFAIWK